MAGNRDFITILREIRGSAAPGQPVTDGIWYELTIADKAGNPGIYGDILAKYGIITESAGTFDQAVAILENLNVVVTTLDAGTQATSSLVNGVWQLGIPRGTAGIDGLDGFTPEVAVKYSLGNLNYTVTVDGNQITNSVLVDLDQLVDTVVNANVDVQTTLTAKQEVIDAVETAQAIADGLDVNVANKIIELNAQTVANIEELNVASAAEQLEISETADAEKLAYDQNAAIRTIQYDENHTTKLTAYNSNDELKTEQYNANHTARLEDINYAYSDRIIEMIKTKNFMGILDEYIAQTETHMITFLSTDDANYIYYGNGTLLKLGIDYTVYNSTTIELVVKANPYDVIVQVNTQLLADMLTAEGALFASSIGVPNGIAGLDANGQVPAAQLPSYVDDVLEVATYADLPTIGEASKIYIVVVDETRTGDTSSYRWTGTTYANISNALTAADIKALYEINTHKVLSSVDSLQFSGGTGAQGTMTWNADEETVDLVQNGTTLQLGQELQIHCTKYVGLPTIQEGTPVIVMGTVGGSGKLLIAPASLSNWKLIVPTATEIPAKQVIGVTTEPISTNGKVTIFGKINDIVGGMYTPDAVYYIDEVTGMLTDIKPTTGLVMAIAKAINNDTLMIRVTQINELFLDHAEVAYSWGNWSTGVTKAFVDGLNVDADTLDGYDSTYFEPADSTILKESEIVNVLTSTLTSAPLSANMGRLLNTNKLEVSIANANNIGRADKYLASQNIANMVYELGNLTKIQYNASTDVDYEVLVYGVDGLSNIAHYVNGTLAGNTALNYTAGDLVSAVFSGV